MYTASTNTCLTHVCLASSVASWLFRIRPQNEMVKYDRTDSCPEQNIHMCVVAGIYLTQLSCDRFPPLRIGPRVPRVFQMKT